MSEAEVDQTIITPAVKAAFNQAKLNNFPDRVKEMYQMEDEQYQQYSIHTQEQIDKGELKSKRKREIARKMIQDGMMGDMIVKYSGLSATELE